MVLHEGSLHIRITELNPWLVMAIDGIGSHDAPSPISLSNLKKRKNRALHGSARLK